MEIAPEEPPADRPPARTEASTQVDAWPQAPEVRLESLNLMRMGASLQEAANQGNLTAILWGIGTLVLVIVALDQLVWRPLLAWADRFKLETVEGEEPPASWLFYDLLRRSRLKEWLSRQVIAPPGERTDAWLLRRFPPSAGETEAGSRHPWLVYSVDRRRGRYAELLAYDDDEGMLYSGI